MRIGEGKCSQCDRVTKLIKGMCQQHYNNNADKIKRAVVKQSERKCEICNVYAVLTRGLCPQCYPKYRKLRNRPDKIKRLYERNKNNKTKRSNVVRT
jgi:hypothetical protein